MLKGRHKGWRDKQHERLPRKREGNGKVFLSTSGHICGPQLEMNYWKLQIDCIYFHMDIELCFKLCVGWKRKGNISENHVLHC
jgi:hypothetical protein